MIKLYLMIDSESDLPSAFRVLSIKPQILRPQHLYDVIISEGVMLVLVHIDNRNALVLATQSRRPRSRA
jgi:hypothetical protein